MGLGVFGGDAGLSVLRRSIRNTSCMLSPFSDKPIVDRDVAYRFDAAGRPVVGQIPGLDPLNVTYDARGRLSAMTQGFGAEECLYAVGYNADGYLARKGQGKFPGQHT